VGVIGLGVVAELVVILGGGGYDVVSRYTGGGGCLIEEDGGTTTEFGATIGLDRSLVCNGSSLSSLDVDAILSSCTFSISFDAVSSFEVDSVD
jgi:hypothetical protein